MSLILIVIASVAIQAKPVPAQAAPLPNVCDPAHDGQEWTDPDTGLTWKCMHVEGVGFRWVPIIKGNRAVTFSSSVNGHAFNRSAYSEGIGNGYSRSIIDALQGATGGTHLNRQPGWLTSRIQLYFWDGLSWVNCADSGWIYNTTTTWQLSQSWLYRFDPPCGSGYYGTQAFGYYLNSTPSGRVWRGGTVWSGYQYTSGSCCLITLAPPAPTQPQPTLTFSPPAATPGTNPATLPEGLVINEAPMD